MKVIQNRDMLNEKYTLSTAAIYPDNASNALFTFFVCEDTVRGDGNPATVAQWKIKGQTAIPYGDYNVVWALSPSRNQWTLRLLNVPGYQGILVHCLIEDMEILTPEGWKGINDEFTEIIGYNRGTGFLEAAPVTARVERVSEEDMYEAQLHEVANMPHLNGFKVTGEHRMLVYEKTRWGAERECIKLAKDLNGYEGYRQAGLLNNDAERLSEQEMAKLKLGIAAMCDGFFRKTKTLPPVVSFHFRKKRKVDRVLELCRQAGYKPKTMRRDKTNDYVIELLRDASEDLLSGRLNLDKSISFDMYSKLHWLDIDELLHELKNFDGRVDCPHLKINLTTRKNIDTIMAMCVCCGRRPNTVQNRYSNQDAKWKDAWELTASREVNVVRYPSQNIVKTREKARVWCVSSRLETIVARRKDFVTIAGNCGNTPEDTEGCLLPGLMRQNGSVLQSKVAVQKIESILVPELQAGNEVVWSIRKS